MINFVLYILLYAGVATIVALILTKEWAKLEKTLKFIWKFVTEIVYELGKTMFIAGLIGIYFVPENKDFTMAMEYGIIFYIVGFGLKKD